MSVSPATHANPTATYFEQMDAATAEKSALLQYLVPGSVADFGADTGQLACRMLKNPDTTDVVAIDNNVDAVRRLREFSRLSTLFGSSERLADIPPVDNIVASSVLHDVYSFTEDQSPGWLAWRTAIAHMVTALRRGGRLIIRDFVTPESPDAPAWLITPDDAAARLVRRYLKLTPFSDLASLIEIREGAFVGSRRTVAEALLTLSWGKQALRRETQARYCLDTQANYSNAVLDVADELGEDLRLVGSSSQVQPGYTHTLANWTFRDETKSDWFPETKALWVFEKY